jgi:hypothetical protein
MADLFYPTRVIIIRLLRDLLGWLESTINSGTFLSLLVERALIVKWSDWKGGGALNSVEMKVGYSVQETTNHL